MESSTPGSFISSSTGLKRKPEWLNDEGYDTRYQLETPGGFAQPIEEDQLSSSDINKILFEGATKRVGSIDAPGTPLLGSMSTCVNVLSSKGVLEVTPNGRLRWSDKPRELISPKRKGGKSQTNTHIIRIPLTNSRTNISEIPVHRIVAATHLDFPANWMPTYHVDHIFGRGVDDQWPHFSENLVWLDPARHAIKSAGETPGNSNRIPETIMSFITSEEDELLSGHWKTAVIPLSFASLVSIHGKAKVLKALDVHETVDPETPGWDERLH